MITVAYRARWVLPIVAPPIEAGEVSVRGGRIVAVGRNLPADRRLDLGHVAILPALVNAHTHLELSHLHGRVPGGATMVDWVERLIALRDGAGGLSGAALPDPREAARVAAREARAAGTLAVGDITNGLECLDAITGAGLSGVAFHEIIGFRADRASALVEQARARIARARVSSPCPISLAVHAPYSVSPRLFELVKAETGASGVPTTVHVAESPEETELLAHGGGPWRALLERFGAWDAAWQPPRMSPVAYLAMLGFLGPRTIAVHCVHVDDDDIRVLARTGTTVVTCPRSNAWIGVGVAPLERLVEAGVAVALGTDSLASAPDLNVLGELAALHEQHPTVLPLRLLEMATRGGAVALGLGDALGALAPGHRAAALVVDIPSNVADVAAHLVSGLDPTAVRWLETSA